MYWRISQWDCHIANCHMTNCHITSSYLEVSSFLDSCDGRNGIIGLCESFLTMGSLLSSYPFPGYSLIPKTRTSMQRSGLALILKHRLRYRERDDFTCWNKGKVEIATIEVQLENEKILFCLVYRPPNAVPDEFFESFESFMSRIRASNLVCIYAGDLNFNLLHLSGLNLVFFLIC